MNEIENTLSSLHADLAQDFATLLQEKKMTSADRSALIKFLKDNNVDLDLKAGKQKSPYSALVAELDELEFDPEEHPVHPIKPNKAIDLTPKITWKGNEAAG